MIAVHTVTSYGTTASYMVDAVFSQTNLDREKPKSLVQLLEVSLHPVHLLCCFAGLRRMYLSAFMIEMGYLI
jgi:hypothetical protein